jgi:hypothetical protein
MPTPNIPVSSKQVGGQRSVLKPFVRTRRRTDAFDYAPRLNESDSHTSSLRRPLCQRRNDAFATPSVISRRLPCFPIRPGAAKFPANAIVSGDRTKRRELAKRYRLEQAFGYDEFDECLRSVDALYIALPNSMHAEYTIRAARAGVHVLCEKPMTVTVDECRRIAACRRCAPDTVEIAPQLRTNRVGADDDRRDSNQDANRVCVS